jgi:hypothetical protein
VVEEAHLPTRLEQEVATGGHWIGVRVTDPARGDRDLLGTVVRVMAGGRTWVQVAQSAHSYLSASDPRPLFGLGGATAYDRIEVTWPDGTREVFPGGPADRWLSLSQGSGVRGQESGKINLRSSNTDP